MRASVRNILAAVTVSMALSPSLAGNFYDAFLSKAIAQCPGFIGGDSQIKITTLYNSFGEGRHRYKSECIPGANFKSTPIKPYEESKQNDGPESDDDDNSDDNDCGSIISPTSGSLGEVIDIPGTDFQLYYSTARSKGRTGFSKVTIPLSDINSNVTGYRVYAEYAGGRILNQSFSNVADQKYTFEWDGKDVNGIEMNRSIPFNFKVIILAHGKEIPIEYRHALGSFKADMLGFGMWMPSIYHFYDTGRNRLVRGNGTVEYVGFRPFPNGDLMVPEKDMSLVYIFNSEGKHLYTKFGLTGANKYEFGYNSNGDVNSIIDAYGKNTQINYSGDRAVEIVSPKGLVTNLEYDSQGYLHKLRNPNHEVYEMTYYPKGMLRSFTKPEGQTSTFIYNNEGHLIKDYHSGGWFKEILLGKQGLLPKKTTKSALGVEENFVVLGALQAHGMVDSTRTNSIGYSVNTRTLYDTKSVSTPSFIEEERYGSDKRFPGIALYRSLKSLTAAGKSVVTSTSSQVGMTDIMDPFSLTTMRFWDRTGNKVSTRFYDAGLKQWTYQTAEGRISKLKLDNQEKPVLIQEGTYLPIEYKYNADGNIEEIKQGERVKTFSYDSRSYLKAVTNSLGQTTRYLRDNAGRVLTQIYPDNREEKYNYDKNGNIIAITPPHKPTHSFILNAFESVREYLPPSLGGVATKTSYRYNLDKQLEKVRRPDGQTISYHYGVGTGYLSSISTPQGQYQFWYSNSVNDYSLMASPYEVWSSFNYEGPFLGQETQGVSANVASVQRKYDEELRIRNITVLAGATESTVERRYDRDNFLLRNGSLVYQRNNSSGKITKMVIGKVSVEQKYDANYGDLNRIEFFHKNKSQLFKEYRRDSLGRISFESSKALGRYFHYDSSGRYIGTSDFGSAKPSHEYKYDENGNRVWSKTPLGIIEATYDSQDRLLTWGHLSFCYNANGELTEIKDNLTNASTFYFYDAMGNMNKVILPNGKVIEYLYDGKNRRVAKTVNGVRSYRYLYEDQLRVTAELDESDTIKKRYIYGNHINVPDYMEYAGKRYLLVKDIRGSVLRVVESESGAVAQELEYDDWGKVIRDTNPGFQPFGFAGGLFDQNTKLVRFGARDYDPEVGRWTSKDPILFGGGDTNLFGYVQNDPVNFIDPEGRNAAAIVATAIAAAILYDVYKDITKGAEWEEDLKKEIERVKKCPRPPSGPSNKGADPSFPKPFPPAGRPPGNPHGAILSGNMG